MDYNLPFTIHPKLIRNYPITATLFLVFTAGLIFPLIWLSSKCETFTVDHEKTILRTGIISKNVNEVFHRDIRNIKVNQTPIQRLTGVGEVLISSAGQSDIEIKIAGIPDPHRIKDIINALRNEDQEAVQRLSVTSANTDGARQADQGKRDWVSVASWGFGLVFLFSGLDYMTRGAVLGGLLFVMISGFLLPPVRKFVQEKLNKNTEQTEDI